MKRPILFILFGAALIPSGCKQQPSAPASETQVTEQQVLSDFAADVANPNYLDVQAKVTLLSQATQTLSGSTNDTNLALARTVWRNARQPWEQCEGFLFGPVEDFNYDPTVDTWPVNNVDLDSLLASANPLTLSDVNALPTSLKGFHPLEYILFGVAGSKTAYQFTDRQKQYMISLAQSLLATTTALRSSWDPGVPGNFTNQLVTAGNGSTRFATRKDAFLAIVTAMSGICDEVANEKMKDPLIAQDSTLEESQFSHNSTADFKNNITGLLHAYTGSYSTGGHGINQLISSMNISLDNQIQSQINSALSSFDNISSDYGWAIYNQKVQIHNTQNALNALKNTLDNSLIPFIQANIKD